ncbi:MAG: tRNA pseudouridine(38-40) synthase TruA [Deltaproteobacteria bacterium]|nr:MAG: tRNA pseudouridine(38-40) synthase TruA [Deltaproteobacteria bacterium]
MDNWRIWLSYSGTCFSGFQKQHKRPSVQKEIEQAFFFILGYIPSLHVAARTDAGVHAIGQVISCKFKSRFTNKSLQSAISHFLIPEITVYRIDKMPLIFHARNHAIGKLYTYKILQKNILLAQKKIFFPFKLDPYKMRIASRYLVGEHDFSSFRSKSCSSNSPNRLIWKISIGIQQSKAFQNTSFNSRNFSPQEINIKILGNAFCHNMVRIIIGTIIKVGSGKINPEQLKKILNEKSRNFSNVTSPASGLYLEEVFYPDTIKNAFLPNWAILPKGNIG